MNLLDEVDLGDLDLTLMGEEQGARHYHAALGAHVSLAITPPEIHVDIDAIDDVRSYFAAMSEEVPALEVDQIELDGCKAIRMIKRFEQQPSGLGYIGVFFLPFRDFMIAVKVQCEEIGFTGMRESVLLFELAEESGAADMQSFIEDQPLVRHDDEGKPTLSLRIFEEERYDDRFPDHPLSRVRRLLGQIEESVTLSERVKAAPAFVFPPE